MDREKLNQAIREVSRDRIVALASELIKIPSFTGEERRVAERAAELLKEKGIQTRKLGTDERPIVLGDINETAAPLIALNGHLDTVPTGTRSTWNRDPFVPLLENDHLLGRGSSDMKASCAVIMHTLEILKRYQNSLKGNVQAQLVPDEEKGGAAGTQLLIDLMKHGKLTKPNYVIIGEKSDLKIRAAERGIFRIDVRFKGRATHTAYARVEGVNAITMAAKAVLALEKPLEMWDPNLGHPVISVNMIKGGTVMNQVPDDCVISIDYRPVGGETIQSITEHITSTLDKISSDLSWKYEIEPAKDTQGKIAFTPANHTSPESTLVKAFQSSIPDIMRTDPEFFVEWAGGTDGRHYREVGVETVGFGPKGEHAHGPNELVDVNSLETQAKIYLSVIFQLLS